MKDDCIFCKLANNVYPTNSIYEDDLFNVILDAGPASKAMLLLYQKNITPTSTKCLTICFKKQLYSLRKWLFA